MEEEVKGSIFLISRAGSPIEAEKIELFPISKL